MNYCGYGMSIIVKKADMLICSGISKFDPNCYVPANNYQQSLSAKNAMNNKEIIKKIAGCSSQLSNYKRTFEHFTNKGIYELYEHLDSLGEMDFIHNYVEKRIKKPKPNKEEFLFL